MAGGLYVAPEHEYPSYLEVRLRVTDSRGLNERRVRPARPARRSVTFVTQPRGLQLMVGSGVVTTPVTITAILNSRISVTANSPQNPAAAWYQFSSWSDGGR